MKLSPIQNVSRHCLNSCFALRLLLLFLVGLPALPSVLAAEEEQEGATLLDQMRAAEYPPIFEYVWRAEINDELTEDRLEDWRRMGFTGFQKRHAPFGGRHFEDGEIVTLTQFSDHPQYYEDDDGNLERLFTLFGDLAHPETPGIIADWIKERIEQEGDNLFRLGDTYLMLTGDEYDLHYGRRPVKFRFAGDEHLAAWRAFLQEDYGDETPGADSAGNGRIYNEEALEPIDSWSDAPRPAFENRFKEPYVWETYRRFLVELNHRFFEKTEEEARERGLPVELALSSHGSVFYPGGPPATAGADPYMQGHRSGALIQEAVFPDWPTSAIGHVFFNRYSQEYGKPVLGWSWFWPGSRHRTDEQFMDSEEVIDRHFARIFPHEVHGLLYWTYTNNVKNFPQNERIAFWHHWFREHWPMLRDSRPAEPKVAVLFPRRAPDFYLSYDYPKKDFTFTVQALIDLQVPYTMIGEYELEEGKGLDGIDLLLIPSADRVSREVADVIAGYIEAGGMVWSNSDSLAMDIGGEPLGLLEEHFGVRLAHKYKRPGYESVLSIEEEQWVKGEEGAELPDKTPYGVAQSPFDMENPQWIDLTDEGWPVSRLRTVNEIVTAEALEDGRVIAEYKGEPVIVETDNTLWVGTRAGADLCAALSHYYLNLAYEPIPDDWPELATTVQGRAPYADLIGRAVEKAGIQRPAEVLYPDGRRANRIETGVRKLDDGGLLLVLSDRDITNFSNETAYTYHLRIAGDDASLQAWDIIEGAPLERASDDSFSVQIPVHGVAYVVVAPDETITTVAERQAKVDGMDLASKEWRHGPRGGPEEAPLPLIVSTGKTRVDGLEQDVLAEVRVSVANTTKEDKIAEPIRLTGDRLLELYPGQPIAGVDGKDIQVQWSGNRGDGVLSSDDVIAWQSDLPAGETKTFTLRFLSKPVETEGGEGFVATADESGTSVKLDDRLLFHTNQLGEWDFRNITLADGEHVSLPPMTGFILHVADRPWLDLATDVVKLRSAEVVADGPVFKTIRLTFADDEDVNGTVAEYTVYARQPENEVRVYAEVSHRVDEMFNLWEMARPPLFHDQRTMTGAVLTLEQSHAHPGRSRADSRTWYEDGMGRLSNAAAAEANNFGGWTATEWRDDGLLQVSFRRVRGVRELVQFMAIGVHPYENEGAEEDGLQVVDNQVVRAAFDLNPPNATAAVDMRIPPGTRWNLDALLSLRRSFDEAQCRAERAAFASPPQIEIQEVVWNEKP